MNPFDFSSFSSLSSDWRIIGSANSDKRVSLSDISSDREYLKSGNMSGNFSSYVLFMSDNTLPDH